MVIMNLNRFNAISRIKSPMQLNLASLIYWNLYSTHEKEKEKKTEEEKNPTKIRQEIFRHT